MAKVQMPGIWEKIQQNVQETERLMGQKKYTQSMIKARQTLEYMVKLQCDRAGIVESSTDTMIRELYNGKWISKTTAEHYLQILTIGNKASREGDSSAYNANEAYHVLTQEIHAFSNADGAASPRRSTQARKSRKNQRSGFSSADLVKLFIPLALIIILIILIRVLSPNKTPTTETAPVIPTEAPTTEAAVTEPETEVSTTAAVSYKTTDTLNVRKEPSTEADRIGKL
ncbi:MAG: N-acetylmuramoyl-L-alanine amidase, partial [bacterium]|nr:N-acetylmuramoyl-L-alanine amidase [bacterium]